MAFTHIKRWQTAAMLLAVSLGLFLLLCLVRIALGKWVRTQLQIRGPRAHCSLFKLRLRDLVYRDPFAFMAMLWSDERDAFARRLWDEVGHAAARAPIAPGALPADGIAVRRMQISDGRALAVIVLPLPQRFGEPYLIGVLLPWDDTRQRDLFRARRALRYFVLSRYEPGRTTDLCEWTMVNGSPRELTYNVGAPTDPVGFARAIEAKLVEMKR
jgi:hypothetical protein